MATTGGCPFGSALNVGAAPLEDEAADGDDPPAASGPLPSSWQALVPAATTASITAVARALASHPFRRPWDETRRAGRPVRSADAGRACEEREEAATRRQAIMPAGVSRHRPARTPAA
ncbi:hypothetical protein [Pseudofrankia asymbiotica]|uniref:hypothetical protein n=1 Tax=Pseudofrankia asymbiotica TaxID=1834516 RepID=UPI001F51D595|nr:hypothetical protein [Pseudofrankia asymbiotica]